MGCPTGPQGVPIQGHSEMMRGVPTVGYPAADQQGAPFLFESVIEADVGYTAGDELPAWENTSDRGRGAGRDDQGGQRRGRSARARSKSRQKKPEGSARKPSRRRRDF